MASSINGAGFLSHSLCPSDSDSDSDSESSVSSVSLFDPEDSLDLEYLFGEINLETPPPGPPSPPPGPPPPPILYNMAFDYDRGYESGYEVDCDPRGPIPQGVHVVPEAFQLPDPRGRERSGLLEDGEDGIRDNDSVYGDFDYDPTRAPECLERTLIPEEIPFRFFVCSPRGSLRSSSVGFINQSNITLLECRAQAGNLFAQSPFGIDVVYNNSSTAWSSSFISETDMRVQLLRRSWDDFFSDHRGEGELRLQFCAGDSVFIVRKALRDYPHKMRIMVIAIAPSCQIPMDWCYLVRYYRSWRDVSSIHFGPNSLPPITEVLVGHPESRGLLDVSFHSSTFSDFIRMEAVCFGLRQELLRAQRLPADYDAVWQGLRDRYMRDSDQDPSLSRSYADVSLRRRQLLADFLSEFEAESLVSSLNNLYEIAEDEYPRTRFESILSALNSARGGIVILEQIMVGFIAGRLLTPAAIGIPILEMLSLLVRSGTSLVQRSSQDERSLIREISLRGGLMHIVCWIYEVGIFSSILSVPRTPEYITRGLGTHIVFTGATVAAENLIYVSPSLRGRLDAFLTRITTSTIRMERNANEEANRVGLIQRITRSAAQVGRGVGNIAVAGVMLYSMFAPTENDATGNQGNDDSLHQNIAHVSVLGIMGLMAAASIVENVRQIRNIFRMLRRMDNGESDREELSEVVEHGGE